PPPVALRLEGLLALLRLGDLLVQALLVGEAVVRGHAEADRRQDEEHQDDDQRLARPALATALLGHRCNLSIAMLGMRLGTCMGRPRRPTHLSSVKEVAGQSIDLTGKAGRAAGPARGAPVVAAPPRVAPAPPPGESALAGANDLDIAHRSPLNSP